MIDRSMRWALLLVFIRWVHLPRQCVLYALAGQSSISRSAARQRVCRTALWCERSARWQWQRSVLEHVLHPAGLCVCQEHWFQWGRRQSRDTAPSRVLVAGLSHHSTDGHQESTQPHWRQGGRPEPVLSVWKGEENCCLLWHCWLGDRKGICKALGVGLLVVTVWLQLYNSSCYHHLHHP